MKKCLRSFVALAGLLVIAGASAQDLSKKVSVNLRGAPVGKVMAELSQATGVPLEAAPSMRGDVLIIAVSDVTLKDLMDRIAQTLNAGWEKVGGGYRLIRGTEHIRAEKEESAARELAAVTESLNRKKKEAAELKPFDARTAELLAQRMADAQKRMPDDGNFDQAAWEQYHRNEQEAPAARTLKRIISQLDPIWIASLPSGQRVVCSTSPTRMQVRMPAGVQNALNTYVQEQNLFARAMKQAMPANQNQFYGSIGNRREITGRLGKVLLIVHKQSQFGGTSVQLMMADEKGRSVGNANDSIGFDWREQQQEMQKAVQLQSEEPKVQLQGDSKKLMDYMMSMYMQGEPGSNAAAPLDTTFRQKLARPEETDPLAYMASDQMFEIARIKDRDIVASVPDMMIVGGFWYGNPKDGVTPTVLLRSLSSSRMAEVIDKDGWIIIKPNQPIQARARRVDRIALGKLLRSAMTKGRTTLDDLATFAAATKIEDEDAFLPYFFIGLVTGKQNNNFEMNMVAYRFYGSLTVYQRQAFTSGQKISMKQLTPEQRELLEKRVFNQGWGLNQSYSEEETMPEAEEDGVIYWDEFSQEPTEVLPNGIPTDGTITGTIEKETVIYLGEQDARSSWMTGRGMTPEELAWEMYSREREDLFPWQRNQVPLKLDKLQTGTRTQVNFNFQFTKRHGLQLGVQENEYTPGAPTSLNGLPAEVKKRYEEAYKQQVEQYKNAKPGEYGGGGGSTSPPPPARH